LQADLRAVNKRLRAIAASDRRTEELKKRKAEKSAPSRQAPESIKGEKPKKAAEEGLGQEGQA
jgi:hypothetical protein